ncbi:MAG TPA: metallophosphoesterase [Kofleriaceae bacterium]|nr:metallophosphoesterase [Kofleriaceae bacterium]
MGGVRRAFVLSDLHLGPGGPLTTFHEAERLAALLDHWRAREPALELVLAGDIFDFLQVPGYDGFSATQAPARFAQIAESPGTARVLGALRQLAARPGVELTVLAGNHDPELLVDGVRDAFAQTIGRAPGTIRWADDEPLVPRDGEHPPVWGRALAAPGAGDDPAKAAWVVHGDRWDPANFIDRDLLRAAAAAGTADGFALPVGSHLVFEVLSQLKRKHRWVDELKPELGAVLPLLLAVMPLETMRYLGKHRGIAASLIVSQIRARYELGPLFTAEASVTQLSPKPDELDAVIGALADALRTEPDAARLLAALEAHLENGPPLESSGVLAGPRGVFGFLVRTWLRVVQKSDRFGRLDGDDATISASERYVPEVLGALIAGHTHGARVRADLRPPYFNSGTWVPVRTVPAGDLTAWLDEVTDEAAPRPPSPGTFVRVELRDGPPLVAVEEWPAKAPP